jgi:hypothetical protein
VEGRRPAPRDLTLALERLLDERLRLVLQLEALTRQRLSSTGEPAGMAEPAGVGEPAGVATLRRDLDRLAARQEQLLTALAEAVPPAGTPFTGAG